MPLSDPNFSWLIWRRMKKIEIDISSRLLEVLEEIKAIGSEDLK
jgi:hypothetical protein